MIIPSGPAPHQGYDRILNGSNEHSRCTPTDQTNIPLFQLDPVIAWVGAAHRRCPKRLYLSQMCFPDRENILQRGPGDERERKSCLIMYLLLSPPLFIDVLQYKYSLSLQIYLLHHDVIRFQHEWVEQPHQPHDGTSSPSLWCGPSL